MEYINQPLLSVIIPVFNVEGYLSKCIDSVLNNNFSSIEIILVNDGSTDNSGDVCNAYAEKFDFIYAFHKENQGVSSSRNYGLDKAIGEWIYFMDSDDWISSDTFTILKEKSEFDIIQFGYKKVNEQGNVLFEMVPSFEESFTNADKYQSDGKFSLMNIVVSFF
ncbi:glycosyltransferase family 2 protein [Sphingobacterium multivorum]|uniref:glycosyltransferase family 2 protein n=3 Tax=Sphingobacteriaceae TaxID=84566 RepID=UPI003015DDD5